MTDERFHGIFSVQIDQSGEIRSADWDANQDGRWSRAWRARDDVIHWHCAMGLDEQLRKAILEKFGLWGWEKEYSLEKILTLSPAELAFGRRNKEKLYNLPFLEIISDTLGDPRPAEEYE